LEITWKYPDQSGLLTELKDSARFILNGTGRMMLRRERRRLLLSNAAMLNA
jgi:hypothetical protein